MNQNQTAEPEVVEGIILPARIESETKASEQVSDVVTRAIDRANRVEIRNQDELQSAATLLGELQKLKRNAESTRTQIVKPLNDHVKDINQKFKAITEPLDAEMAILKNKASAFQRQEEEKRRVEQERLDAERKERERIAREAQEKAELEARERREEAERLAREAEESASGAVDSSIEEAAEEAAAALDRARAEEEALAASQPEPEVAAPVLDTGPVKVKGLSTRKVWTFKIVDESKVPREWMLIDESAIRKRMLQSISEDRESCNLEIPGVEFVRDTSTAVTG